MTSHHFNIETTGTADNAAMGLSIAQIAARAGLAMHYDTHPMLHNLPSRPGEPRHCPSPRLARRTQSGLSLTQPEAPDAPEAPETPSAADINASNEASQ